ncbi:MAG TPA: hypothetical protein VJ965_12735, partial [Anaerolineales bacterium]|nr:hypothetical protein [Anaerolineales bacterium]
FLNLVSISENSTTGSSLPGEMNSNFDGWYTISLNDCQGVNSSPTHSTFSIIPHTQFISLDNALAGGHLLFISADPTEGE